MNPVFAKILRVWMVLLLALLVLQFALAGFGVGYSGALDDGFEMHFRNGNLLLFLYAAAILPALAARAGARIVWLIALGAFLILLQHGMAIANVPGTIWGQSLFLVHALNGLALIFLTHRIGRLVRNRMRPRSGTAEAATAESRLTCEARGACWSSTTPAFPTEHYKRDGSRISGATDGSGVPLSSQSSAGQRPAST
jgi:hypothetical protein